MLFDDARPQRHRRHGRHVRFGVVGKSGRERGPFTQGRKPAEVNFLQRARIGGNAMEQRQRGVVFLLYGLHGPVHLVPGGHAGGEDQRLSLGGEIFQECQVRQLAGTDLEGREGNGIEQVGAGFVERR